MTRYRPKGSSLSTDTKRAIGAIAAMVTFAASFVAAGAVGGWHGTSVASPNLDMCEYEDGNSNGTPCNWQDSKGRWRANDSSRYREKGR